MATPPRADLLRRSAPGDRSARSDDGAARRERRASGRSHLAVLALAVALVLGLAAAPVAGAVGAQDAGSQDAEFDDGVLPAVQEPVPTIDGATPRDHDDDGRYEDVAGSGTLEQADVAVFFERHHRERVSAHPEYFDYSGNGGVGHEDVLVLFEAATVGSDAIEPRATEPTDDFLATVRVDATSVEVGEELTLEAVDESGADQSLQSVEWQLGDGTEAAGRTVSHAYAEPGTYRVSLTATGDYGASTTHTLDVHVEDGSGVEECDGTSPDSDGDGIPDCPEEHYDHLFPDSDPAVFDVYVEVSHLSEEFPLTDQEVAELEAVFDEAPTEAEVELHLIDGGTVPYQGEYEIFEYHQFKDPVLACAGYHHGFVADRSLGDAGGYGYNGEFSVIEGGWAQQNIFLHELGHSLGLTEFEGIDSEQYTLEQYPSSMNYNGVYEMLGFSDGTNSAVDHDDWAVVTGQDPSGYQPGYDGGCTDDDQPELTVVS